MKPLTFPQFTASLSVRFALLVVVIGVAGACSAPGPDVQDRVVGETAVVTQEVERSATPRAQVRQATATPGPDASSTPTSTPAPRPTATAPPATPAAAAPTRLPVLDSPPVLPLPDIPDHASFEQVLRQEVEDVIPLVDDLPWYRLNLEVSVEQGLLRGNEELIFTNREDVALEEVVLRLYDNVSYTPDGVEGRDDTRISEVTVDGAPVEVAYAASNTAVVVPLPRPLPPGDTVRLRVGFTNQLEEGRSDPAGTWRFASFYPQLSVHDETGWRLDMNRTGDLVFSESANYIIELTLPDEMALAISGTPIGELANGEGTVTYTILGLGMRDVAFTFGEWQVSRATVDGTTINLWHVADDPLVDEKLATAAEALRVFNQRFGFYPYNELDIVSRYRSDWGGEGGAGHEYSGLVTHVHGKTAGLHALAHEIAHEWWFDLVGNDTQQEPWLDEAMANYSSYLFFQDAHGEEEAQRVLNELILPVYRNLREESPALARGPIGRPVYAFDSGWAYFGLVYSKGTLFLDALRSEMGDEAFFSFLSQYYREFRYEVATGEDFLNLAEQVAGKELDDLFEDWVWP